ncbi:zinc-dependent alcohol dehydrogenase [Sphingomonas sp. 3-13AW]|uniref:zinc-dependent alcohol dehydrogenase n=1 Tax=Sphingomonas sp. 3-13AW TaxID=3050450 RepID=UPI003BB7DA52
MKAALKKRDGTFEIADVERPTLRDSNFVLARVRVAGICGTDLRHWKVEDPSLECHIMGHELAGEVVEVGPDVFNVKPGDRVVIETVMGDGVCPYCKVQRYNICEHLYDVRTQFVSRAYAEYVAGPSQKFYRLPDHVSFEEAALVDTLSVCLHGQHLSGLSINNKVVIIGAGCIGLGQTMLAKASGADVMITDIVDSALDLARSLGADRTVNTHRDDWQSAVLEWTDGRGADIVFECAGGEAMPMTLPQATKMVRRGGKVVIIGGFDAGETAIPLEWQRIQMSEIQLIPSASFAYHDIYAEQGQVVELISAGKLPVSKLITHRFPLDRINEAFGTARDKTNTGAVFVAIET